MSGEHLTDVTSAAGTTTYTYTPEASGPRAHALVDRDTPATHQFFTYDSHGRIQLSQNDAGANAVTYTYRDAGYRVTDAENHSATILFDQNFRVVAAFDPLEHPSGANFDADGNVSAVATLGGGVSTFVFDKTTNQLTITDAMNTVETMAFGDNFYPLQSITDGNFNVTSFGYDANGNPATTAYPDGTTETVVYDANGTVKRPLIAPTKPRPTPTIPQGCSRASVYRMGPILIIRMMPMAISLRQPTRMAPLS